MNQVYKFSNDYRILKNGERVILINRNSGEWLKISQQCHSILNIGIENDLTESQLIGILTDEEDKKYFMELFQKLKEMDLITYTSDQEYCTSIKQIYFALTHRCNLKCIHCCFSADSTSGEDFLSTKQVLNIIDKIIACSPEMITFTGGEPLLRSDFIKILQYVAQRYKGKISLSTNATLINSKNVKILSSLLSSIDISLDGVDEKSCSQLRGTGVFNKVMESVSLLRNNNFEKISLSMVVVDGNQHLQEKFRKLNEDLGTMPLIRNFAPIGRGKENKEKLQINEENTGQTHISYSHNDLKIISKGLKGCSCGAARNQFLINFDGSIYPCGLLIKQEYRLGDINDVDDIRSYINNISCKSQAYKELNKIEPNTFIRCHDCSVNLFCWSCLNDIDQIKNDEDAINNRCLARKPLLSKIVWDT